MLRNEYLVLRELKEEQTGFATDSIQHGGDSVTVNLFLKVFSVEAVNLWLIASRVDVSEL